MEWLDREKIVLSTREAALTSRPFASWTYEETEVVAWRYEAAVALLRALGVLESMPSCTELIPISVVMGHIPMCQPLARTNVLRPASEIERQAEVAGFWNWRARTESFRRMGVRAPAGDSLRSDGSARWRAPSSRAS